MILKRGNRGIRLSAVFLILTVTTGVMAGCAFGSATMPDWIRDRWRGF